MKGPNTEKKIQEKDSLFSYLKRWIYLILMVEKQNLVTKKVESIKSKNLAILRFDRWDWQILLYLNHIFPKLEMLGRVVAKQWKTQLPIPI